MLTPAQLTKLRPWSRTLEELFQQLSTNPKGLGDTEAKNRLKTFGLNDLEKHQERGWLTIFLSQYKNPLIIILIVASLVSLFTGDHLDATIILLMIAINSILGFIQEYRSEKAAELLRHKASLKSMILRNNTETKISARLLVPGDIVKLSQGSVVPADLRLIETKGLTIDESLLTGESFPVEKITSLLPSKVTLPQEQKNLAFSGTSVLTGEATGVVTATGENSLLGKSATSLEKIEVETEFQSGVRRFGNFLVVLIIILVVFIFLINIFLKPLIFHISPNYLEALLFSLALAIGITPELLPFIITLNLSRGALQMSKKHAIVKKLISIEDIGNADVLCTDKTGTITEGKIFLENYFDYQGHPDPELLVYSLLANEENQDNAHPLDKALVEYPGIKEALGKIGNFQRLGELPFDFSRKRYSVLVKNSENYLIITKGATEQILANCTLIRTNGENKLLLDKQRKNLNEKYIQLSSQGYRLLAVAVKKIKTKKQLTLADEQGLTFWGFLAFSDRPKHTVSETLQQLENLSVQIKILTGDNEYVAKHICQEVGLPVQGIVLGESLDKFSDLELKNQIGQTTIFAKITPEHKLRIIKAIKDSGHTVAFLGDGANDAPALKVADVGISVDTALDVAKEAADIILMRKSLEVLIEAVKDGRRTFGNSMKYIYEASSSNFGNMFSLAGASLFLPFIPMLPSQVILLNFMGDVPSLAISTDSVDPEYLKKPKHWDIRAIGSFMIPFGLLSSFFDFSTFFLLIYVAQNLINPQSIFRTGWFLESLATEILVFYLIRTRRVFWKSRPSTPVLVFGSLSLIAGLVLTVSPLGRVFQFIPLPTLILALIGLLVFFYIFLVEVLKRIYYARFSN